MILKRVFMVLIVGVALNLNTVVMASTVPSDVGAVAPVSASAQVTQTVQGANIDSQTETDPTTTAEQELQIELEEGDAAAIGGILIVILVLAVVFEVALTPIFSWSIFIERFHGKGLKTPITILLAFLFFWQFKLDIIGDLLKHMTTGVVPHSWQGRILTALLISGGSAGIYRLFNQLGIQNYDGRVQEVLEQDMQTVRQPEEALENRGASAPNRIVPTVSR